MGKYFLKFGFIALMVLGATQAGAAYVYSGVSNITFLSVYGRGGAPGDVLVKISHPASECVDGYYASADSVGKQEILTTLLSAYHGGKKITVNGFDEPNWRGSSSNNMCEIESVAFAEY